MPESSSSLRFTCVRGCTACCEQNGWVYVTDADIARAAAWLHLTEAEFETRYVYRTRHRARLRKPKGAQCHFLKEGGCGIHPAKPTQCRMFPFWPELVEDRKAWKQTARYCPGIGQGPLIQIGTAVELAHQMRTAYPAYYSSHNSSGTAKT
jgi:Fe-S-cluster containining protein